MQGGHDKCALVISAFVNQHGAIQVHSRCREDTTSARLWCPRAQWRHLLRGHDKPGFVVSSQPQRMGRPRDTTSARLWCPLANQAPGDVADGVGRADQRDEKQHGKQDDAGLSNHVVDATGQRASSPLVNGWQQSRN